MPSKNKFTTYHVKGRLLADSYRISILGPEMLGLSTKLFSSVQFIVDMVSHIINTRFLIYVMDCFFTIIPRKCDLLPDLLDTCHKFMFYGTRPSPAYAGFGLSTKKTAAPQKGCGVTSSHLNSFTYCLDNKA